MRYIDGGGVKPEAGYTLHYDTGGSAVSSISKKTNTIYRLRQLLAAVLHNTHPY